MAYVDRRDFLTGAAGLAAAATASQSGNGQLQAAPQMGASSLELIRGSDGATILGPWYWDREIQRLDRLRPPATDYGSVPNLRWYFADSHNHLSDGSWPVKQRCVNYASPWSPSM
jgi:oxalate decarboxylase